jgi:hypothetical protein
MSCLTQEQLKEILDYDPETGFFTWRSRNARCVKIGSRAGSISKTEGYCVIQISRKLYKAHRLAWLYVYGEWPPYQVDHINGVKSDNAIANLRSATNAENQRNRPAPSINSTGYKGVYRAQGGVKYCAQIMVEERTIHLGTYETPQQAHAAYCEAATKYHGDFARFD